MSVLEEIAKKVTGRLDARKKLLSQEQLTEGLQPRTLVDIQTVFPAGKINILAEIKKASPSEGDIAPKAVPTEVAKSYLDNGARGLSILTEEDYFKGSLSYLAAIRQAYPESFLLMKDFIVDEYQILEGVKAGASSILLILSLLDEEKAEKLFAFAHSWGLHALVEVHNEEEMIRAMMMSAKFIGVNNRNLNTLKIDLTTSENLASHAPPDSLLVCESGLNSGKDLNHLKSYGYQAFLMGTHFMKTRDPGSSLSQILKEAKREN